MAFWVYDVGFLIVFSIFIAIFLYFKKKNMKREGIMFLYKTQLGIKTINYIAETFAPVLKRLKYIIIGIGYALMALMLYLFMKSLYIYIAFPQITKLIKAPPIAPLIPYFPKLFGMESFFPPFYFTYFILALLIIAVVHEFSHGIFMRLFKVKILSTGFAFLGPILGAFVEQDQKQMEKKPKIEQLTILGAGVFSNLIFAGIFFLLLVGFFFLTFSPAGFIFSDYGMTLLPVNNITSIDVAGNLTTIHANNNQTYYLDAGLQGQLTTAATQLIVYEDSPAFRVQSQGAIVAVDGVKIKNQEDLRQFLETKKPGDKITLTTKNSTELTNYDIELGKHPLDNNKPYIGVGGAQAQVTGFFSLIMSKLTSFKNPATLYEPRLDGELVIFIYNLFWWLALINLFVALFNMLPLGIMDGGQFFYLTILGLVKSEKTAKLTFKIVTYVILGIFALMMFFWVIRL